jgi:transcriptional regulator with XRE-family HTH domain
MVAAWQEDPEFRQAYDELAEEFELFDELLKARTRAGLTQAEVAERMGTKTPAVARLEAGGGRQKHSPSLATLHKYAEAVGCRLAIKLIPHAQLSRQKREVQTDDRQAVLPGVSSTSQLHKTSPAKQGNRADG